MRNPLRVLVVEDDPAHVEMLRRALEPIPHQMQVLSDGQEAEDYVRSHPQDIPDLIILDMRLPKVDGTDVLRTLKDSTKLAQVPVLVVSSLITPDQRSFVKDFYGDLILEKPVSSDWFCAWVNALQSAK